MRSDSDGELTETQNAPTRQYHPSGTAVALMWYHPLHFDGTVYIAPMVPVPMMRCERGYEVLHERGCDVAFYRCYRTPQESDHFIIFYVFSKTGLRVPSKHDELQFVI